MILALRTDKPEAELCLYKDGEVLGSYSWQAHRELSDTLLLKIEALLKKYSLAKADLTGVIVYQGPGSFTGLRIGITVANTLAYSLNIHIIAAAGEDWQKQGIARIANPTFISGTVPHYGGEVRITKPRK